MFRQYQSFISFHAWIIRESFVILHAHFNIEMQDFIFYTPEGNCESPTDVYKRQGQIPCETHHQIRRLQCRPGRTAAHTPQLHAVPQIGRAHV